jgi:hypothetical protein
LGQVHPREEEFPEEPTATCKSVELFANHLSKNLLVRTADLTSSCNVVCLKKVNFPLVRASL